MALTKVPGPLIDIDALAADYTAGSGTIYVLATGQSNSIGRDDSGHFQIDSRVKAWDNENDIDTLSNLGDSFDTPVMANRPFVGTKNNMWVHFCSRLAVLTNRQVRLILVAKGATTSDGWWTGSEGPMLTRIKAVLAAASVTALDIVCIHQGEGNNSPSGIIEFEADWNAVLADLDSDGYITDATPVLFGEIGTENGEYINPKLHEMAAADPRKAVITMELLEIADPLGDNAHFTGEALCRAGSVSAINALSRTETIWKNVSGVPYLDETDIVISRSTGLATLPRPAIVTEARYVTARGIRRQSLSNLSMAQNTSTLVPLTVTGGYVYGVKPVGYFAPWRQGLWRISVRSKLTWGGIQYLRLQDIDGNQRIIGAKSTTDNTGIVETLTGFEVRAYSLSDLAYLYCEHGKSGGITLTSDEAFDAFEFHAEYLGA